MEYKNENLLDNTPNQAYKFTIKYFIEINNDGRRTNNTKIQFEFKTAMLK